MSRIAELKAILVPENQAVLDRFSEDGVDLTIEKEVSFSVEMPSKTDVFKCSAIMRKLFVREAFHIAVNPISDDDPVYYRYDIVVPLTADAISQVEAELLSVCEQHDGGPSFWEFAGDG